MENQNTAQPVRLSETLKLAVNDPILERAQEIDELIARRAYDLFASSGCLHGHDLEHWLRAESEILRGTPLEVAETETELTIRADVPGFSEKDLEVRVEPRRLLIAGKRPEEPEQAKGRTVYSERHFSRMFRVLNLPTEVDPHGVRAMVSDGVLEVTLPKAEAGKKIPVLAKAASA